MDSMEDTIVAEMDFLDEKQLVRTRDKFGLVMWLIFGVFGTIGGWWFVLSMLFSAFGVDIYFFLDSYSFLSFTLATITLVTLWVALILGGPYIINNTIKEYHEKVKEADS